MTSLRRLIEEDEGGIELKQEDVDNVGCESRNLIVIGYGWNFFMKGGSHSFASFMVALVI